jgi:peptidoglycan/LPS O-acetylase OafA/YrhL
MFPGLAPGGFVGVDVFFVISGYLISQILLRELDEQRFSVLRFYRRRVRRIFPALIILLLTSAVCGWALLPPDLLRQLGKHIAASAAFVPNFTFWAEPGYFSNTASEKPLLHLWSLGVEEQFYALWPLTLFLLHRLNIAPRFGILAIGAISFAWSIVEVDTARQSAFFLPAPRAWELMAGAAIASFERAGALRTLRAQPLLGFVGLGAIVLSARLLQQSSLFPGWWALAPVLGAGLVIAEPERGLSGRLLSCSPLRRIGLISYPLYLWHWPMLSFAAIECAPAWPSRGLRLLLVLCAIALAELTYRVIEQPIRSRSDNRQTAALVALMAAIGLLGLVIFHAGNSARAQAPRSVAGWASDPQCAVSNRVSAGGRRALALMLQTAKSS